MKLDSIDIMILNELMADGRASLREVAKKTSLSTPTVSSRFDRVMKAGLIKKFVPVFNLEATSSQGVIAFVNIKAPASAVSNVAKKLAHIKQVLGVFITTGESIITLKVISENTQALQHFLTGKYLRDLGVEVVSTQIITETLKDEYPVPFADEFTMNLKCDLCKGDITSNRPYTIKVGSVRYYFCCKTCRRSYLDRHAARIVALNERFRTT